MARLRGSGPERPLLLLAHLDVVDARREDWSVDPFTLLERDGFFYGRGTLRRQGDGGDLHDPRPSSARASTDRCGAT